MSDHWESFPCTMGDCHAFITYDHGIRDDIDELPFPNCTSYTITLRDPDDRGLPQGKEFETLNRIEGRLEEEVSAERGVNVGRITTDGRRHVFFYTKLDEAVAGEIGARVSSEFGYDLSLSHGADPERNGYWKKLFPTEDDWQVIQDIHIEDALRQAGDALARPRPISHWAYFAQVADRQRFVDAVAHRFESLELNEAAERANGMHAVRLTHTGLPDHRSMNATTLLLRREAERFGGEYDGWETEVCKG